MSPTATLLLSCPDQPGLVAAVAEFIFGNGGNIVHADQHTDSEEGIFFQRVEFGLDGFAIARGDIASAFDDLASRFHMQTQLAFSDEVPRVAVMMRVGSRSTIPPAERLE
jgi:formyltetrahydrofolate deformylase